MIRSLSVRQFAPALVAASFLIATAGLGAQDSPKAPQRLYLFDHMDQAAWGSTARAGVPRVEPRRTTFSFAEGEPAGLAFGRVDGGRLRFDSEGGGDMVAVASPVAIDPQGGVEGPGLRIGPGVPEDTSRAVFLAAAAGPSRVRITGRVRIDGLSLVQATPDREVLRVIERSTTPDRTRRFSRNVAPNSAVHRASRVAATDGWDSFDLSFLTEAGTRSLEIQLLHRSAGEEGAITRFDSIVVLEQLLTGTEIAEQLRARYAPRDGRELDTPWRLRVELTAKDSRQPEMRDALLLNAPAHFTVPVQVPPAEDAPLLRFQYGMLPEAFRVPGDGAVLEVRFRVGEDEVVPIGEVTFDPKGERADRRWHEARFDLTPVAGRVGHMEFLSRDLPGTEPDTLDAVLLSGPRIEPADAAPAVPNVLLIGVDTLRADHMSAFGYDRPTTPNLEELAAAGIRFPETRSQAPWTLPSFSSILTSTYPSRHGAGRGGHDEWTPIDPTTTSLAELLSRVGYETWGLVANGLISPRYGLDQGFEGYRSAWAMESAAEDAGTMARFVDEHRTTPWLAFWHIMDPHLPYTTEASFREEFTDPAYAGRFTGRRGAYVPFEVLDPRPGRRWFTHEGPPPLPDLTADDRRFVADYYDAEIAEMDAAVGRVLEALKESGQWDRTIVAFVADHGEGLGDHMHYHHGYTLFDDQVHIPMLLRIPGRDEGRVVARPVAAIDLAPMILGALGLVPPDFFQGIDRLGANAPVDDAYFIEYPTYDSSAQKAWIQGEFKYLHDPVFHTEALYHRGSDPGETTNVAALYPEVVARARAEMDAFRWEQLQKGRAHLRIRGEPGRRLQVRIETSDLFDANFTSRPVLPEERFTMDDDRRRLGLDTVMGEEALELVFWCRGQRVELTVTLDGEPLTAGLVFGAKEAVTALPTSFPLDSVPVQEGSKLPWPRRMQACLWVEAGVSDLLPVVPSPEELEVLRKLGYAR